MGVANTIPKYFNAFIATIIKTNSRYDEFVNILDNIETIPFVVFSTPFSTILRLETEA